MIDKANPNPTFMGPFLHHDYYITSHVDALNSKNSGYWPLEQVLLAAYAQAADGKGAERHALGDGFLDQPIITIGQMLKSADGEAYQAIKKLREGLQMAKRGEYDAAIREFLGAINYVAAVAILIAEEQDTKGPADFYADGLADGQRFGKELQDDFLAEGLRFRKELQVEASQKEEPVPMAEAVAKLKSLDSGVTTQDAERIINASVMGAIFENQVSDEFFNLAEPRKAKYADKARYALISRDRSHYIEVSGNEVVSFLTAGYVFFHNVPKAVQVVDESHHFKVAKEAEKGETND